MMKSRNHFQKRNLMLLMLLALLIGCKSEEPNNSASGNPPKAAVDVAIETAKVAWPESKNFRVSCSEHLELTPADKENGIQEKWCIKVSFVYKFNPSSDWEDMKHTRVIARQSGSWKDVSPMIVECCR
ncbi:MAG: hypothetical protein ACREEM_38900 [Blastocatellia bacterium]